MFVRRDNDAIDGLSLRDKFIREAEQDIEAGLCRGRKPASWPRSPVPIHVRRQLLAALFTEVLEDQPAKSRIARRA